MIEVDGSLGEGGGQILRTAVALASVLEKEVRILRIRAGRSQPGIKAQHLTGVRAAAEVCGATVKGAEEGSTELVYKPGTPKSGRFSFDVGTAGSVTLVLQTLMPVMAFAPGKVELELKGGTDVKWSPPIDYLRLVILQVLEKMGLHGELELIQRGHYPRGGGKVRFIIQPGNGLRPFSGRKTGEVTEIGGVSHAVGLSRRVAERQAESAGKVVQAKGFLEPRLRVEVSQVQGQAGPGSGIVLYARTRSGAILGADSLGERGKMAEIVGVEAGERLVEEVGSGALLDRHMGDIIVPYMALAQGLSEVSVSKITQHTLTNVKVAEQLAGVRFEVQGRLGERGVVRVRGLGIRAAPSSSSSIGPDHSSHL
jgi:RNA 3'-terminal phosphate cyclase (ATP)